jgi:aldehyde dehydrogenase (NAD+)
VKAAREAFDTTWGLNASGHMRSVLLSKLALLMEAHADELAALEALDNGQFLIQSVHCIFLNVLSGKTFARAKHADVASSIEAIRYYAGWADKLTGKVMETTEKKLTYTRHEPIGVCVCPAFSYHVYEIYSVQ